MRVRLVVVYAVSALWLASSPVAIAGELSGTDGSVAYRGDDAANELRIDYVDGAPGQQRPALRFFQPRDPFSVSGTCVLVEANTAQCDDVLEVDVTLAAGDDEVALEKEHPREREGPTGRWDAGPGNDRVRVAGVGLVVQGGSGNDRLTLYGGGHNIIDGGAGKDTIVFEPTVYGCSRADGGPGDDTFVAPLSSCSLNADGGAGYDKLVLRTNCFVAAGARGCAAGVVDRIVGTKRDDLIIGGKGQEQIVGGRGSDDLRGGKGNDLLMARDKERDKRIDCGSGSADRAVIDSRDPAPARCERVDRD